MSANGGRLAFIAISAIVLVGTVVALVLADRRSSARQDPREGAAADSLVWADDFTGRAGTLDPRRWGFETGGRWDGELQAYTRRLANARLDGKGHLAITARRERYTGADGVTRRYTSARLNTHDRFVFAYGRVEARIRVTTGRGIHAAFWALGNNLGSVGWPASGEIDLMEVDSADPTLLFGTVHGPRGRRGRYYLRAKTRLTAPLSREFHVYGISWTPGTVVFTVDGRAYGAFTRGDQPSGSRWPFDHPFYLLFTVAVGGQASAAPNASTRWPATMLVDWVRVWRLPQTFCPTVRISRFRSRCPARAH